jgi:hypothetical protein
LENGMNETTEVDCEALSKLCPCMSLKYSFV